jgi:hypothetical protein
MTVTVAVTVTVTVTVSKGLTESALVPDTTAAVIAATSIENSFNAMFLVTI